MENGMGKILTHDEWNGPETTLLRLLHGFFFLIFTEFVHLPLLHQETLEEAVEEEMKLFCGERKVDSQASHL